MWKLPNLSQEEAEEAQHSYNVGKRIATAYYSLGLSMLTSKLNTSKLNTSLPGH